MNKKRVALALAAALGVNTLMVTVGQVGQQTVIAHATQASGRLVQGQENLLNTLNFTQLNIKSVETLADGKTSLTFDLKKEDVKEIKVSKAFTHKVFTDRTIGGTAIDTEQKTGLPSTGKWSETNGTFELNGKLEQPGIYTGDITIEYKDGRTPETYTISLRKMPNDTLTVKKVEVTEGAIKIKNGDVELNGKIQVGLDTVASTDLVLRTSNGDIKGSYNTTTGEYVFNSGIDFKVGNTYELVYKYGGSTEKYEAVAHILLVEQDNPEVKAYATNAAANLGDVSKDATFKAAVAKDYGVDEADVTAATTVAAGTAQYDQGFKVTADGVDVVTYSQTLWGAAGTPGGATLTLDTSVEGEVKATVGSAKLTGANFVPAFELGYGNATNNTKTLFGNYYMTFGDKTVSYFDAGTGMSDPKADTTGYFLTIQGGPNTAITVDAANSSVTYPVTSGHGYTSVSVDFTVDKNGKIAGNTYSQLKQIVETAAGTANTPVIPSLDPKEATITGTVKTAVIISRDSIEGEVVQAKFEQKAGQTGRGTLTVVNGAKLVKGLGDNEIPAKFTVTDTNGNSGTVTLDNITTGGDIILNVTFNTTTFPSEVKWNFANGSTKLEGTLATSGLVEAVNFDGTVGKTNTNTDRIENRFEITAKFNSVVPSGANLKVDQDGGTTDLNFVDYTKFQKGQHTITAKVDEKTNKYAGTYSAGIWVQKQDFTVELKATSATSSSVTLEVVGKDVVTDALKKVNKAYVQYRLSGTTEWKNGVEIAKADAQTTDKKISVTQSGLESGKEYDFRVVYEGTNANDKVYSTVVEKYKTNTSGSSTITGNGSSSSTTGTSTGSTTINVTTNNSTLSGTSASVTLPTSFRYDSSKTPVAVTFKYKDKDGKVVTETKEQFSNVTAKFNGDKVEVNGLVPGKNYDEITVDYTDNNGRTRSIILRNIQTSTTVESEKYLANVYEVVLSRPADEAGYHFHLNNLKNKKVSLREFLLNMLSEKEFIEKYKSTEEKIEGLYNAIVARSSDEAGKKFWVDEYKKVLAVYGSETTALKAIADRMVNENELKELADKMGVQW